MLRRSPGPRPQLELVHSRPEAADDPLPLSARAFWLLCAGAIGLGFLLRASFVLGSDFPLNDGGMFYQMTRDLQAHGYGLPATTSYNAAGIPFGYPPLGFYLTGAIDSLTPLSLLGAYRLVPLMASTALLGAFLLLSQRVLRTRAEVVIALVIFATLAPTFRWMIMGGGATRAPGFVFALLAMREVDVMFETRSWRRAVAAGVLSGLTLLSHLEMAWFAALICGLLFVARGRSREGAVLSMAVCAVALAVSAPWWATVLAQDGAGAFASAAGSGSPAPFPAVVHLLQFAVTAEPLFTLLAALALLGLLACVARREWLLPAWILVVALLDPRAFPTSASPAIAMLGAVAVASVLVPLARNGVGAGSAGRAPGPAWLVPALLVGATVYAFLGAMISAPHRLEGLTTGEREAMAWARAHTDASARFAIITDDAWPLDRNAEWFPALAQRRAVATVQGYEWIGSTFRGRIDSYDALQECASQDAACLDAWSADAGEPFDYVYVPKIAARKETTPDEDCCQPLLTDLRRSEAYELVFDGPGAAIFERR